MMINFLNKLFSVENQKTSKGDYIMGRQALSKTTKIRNLFNTGADVTWKSLRASAPFFYRIIKIANEVY